MTQGNLKTLQGDRWFGCLKPRQNPRLRLFCFPYAGGGAMIYRTWSDQLPSSVEVCPVALPGRERRMREAGFTRMAPLVDALVEALDPYLDDLPFAFFGHSMGSAIAYELCHRLRLDGRPQPKMLIASGRRAPHLTGDDKADYLLPDDAFIERLREMQGTPEEVLANRELMDLMVPLLKADFELIDTHGPTDFARLDLPIVACGGLQDGEVSRRELEAWGELTAGEFTLRLFEGGHFFLQEATKPRLMATLTHHLRAVIQEL